MQESWRRRIVLAGTLIATLIAVGCSGSVRDWSSHSALLTDFKLACVDTRARPGDVSAAVKQMNAKLVQSGTSHTAWLNMRNGHRIDIWLDDIDGLDHNDHRGICTVSDFNDGDDSANGLKEWLGVNPDKEFSVYDLDISNGKAVDVFNLSEHKDLDPDRRRRPYRLIVMNFNGSSHLTMGNQYSDLGDPSGLPARR